MEETDIKCGLLGLDPRTHLLSFFLVGIVSMLIVNLLETVLTGIRYSLSRRKRTDEKCDKDLCELHSHMRPELPSPPRAVRSSFCKHAAHDSPVYDRLRVLLAFSFGDHVRTRPVASPAKIPRWDLHDIQICLDPSV